MESVPEHSTALVAERGRQLELLRQREPWAGVAIASMWIAVLFDAVFGPDIVSAGNGTTTTVPSVVLVAICAAIGTVVVARAAFSHDEG